MYDLLPTRLSKHDLKAILEDFDPETQAYRILDHVGRSDGIPTGKLSARTSTGNISMVVITLINPKLESYGLVIRCERPLNPIRNKFRQTTQQHVWKLYKMVEKGSMAG